MRRTHLFTLYVERSEHQKNENQSVFTLRQHRVAACDAEMKLFLRALTGAGRLDALMR